MRLFLICLLLLAVTACEPKVSPTAAPAASSPTPGATSERVVHVSADRVEVSAGESGQAVVRLTIDQGYHVNANPPTFPYLIATQLILPASSGISLEKVEYPTALKRKFEFAEQELAVYEGQAELRANIKADSTASKGEASVPATLRVQACDEQVCYPPGTINLNIPVVIK